MVPADGRVTLDDEGVDVGNEEESGNGADATAGTQGDGDNVVRRLLVQAQVGAALVDDGQGADGTGDKEEEGRGIDGPGRRVLAHVDHHLDEHEDDASEAGRDGRGHTETGENGTESLTVIPAPLDLGSTDSGDTDAGNSRDERVGRRDVGGVLGAPHDPRRRGSESAGESKHLDAGVVLEGRVGNNAVLDGIRGTGADGDGTDHLEDGTQNHGLSVGDRPGRDTGGPRVGDIV